MFQWMRHSVEKILLRDKSLKFLFDPPPEGEAIALDCECTGLDPWVDDIISIAAIPIRDNLIATSERFEVILKPDAIMRSEAIKVHRLLKADVAEGRSMEEVMPELLHFIGSRPIVGYYIDFDMTMLDKYMLDFYNIRLPNKRIEVSQLYYERRYRKASPGTEVDLSFDRIMEALHLPNRHAHDAFNDALMAAMMYVRLADMKERGVYVNRSDAHEGDGDRGTYLG